MQNERKTMCSSDKLNYYFHTTSDSNFLKILNDSNGKLKVKKNKYLNDYLIYFYYGQDIAYTYSNDIKSFYFPIILGFKKESFIKGNYNLYPFDTGGVIARLDKSLEDITKFKISTVNEINNKITELYGGNENYLSSKHKKVVSDKKYMELFKEINAGISANLVDRRILYFELSSKTDMELEKHLSCIIAPRAYFRPYRKSENKKSLSDMERIKNKIKNEEDIDNYSIDFTPIKLAIYKDSSIKELSDFKIGRKDGYIELSLNSIVNTIPYLSGFCSILLEFTKDLKPQLFEIYTSLLIKEMVNFYPQNISDNNSFNSVTNDSDEKYLTRLILNKSQKAKLHYSKSINIISFGNNSIERFFCTYKVTNDFIIFGDILDILKFIAYLVPSIEDQVGTYREISETIRDYNEYFRKLNSTVSIKELFENDLKSAEVLWTDKKNSEKNYDLDVFMDNKYNDLLDGTEINVTEDCWVLYKRKIIPINEVDLDNKELLKALMFRNYSKNKESYIVINERHERVSQRFTAMKENLMK